MRKKVFIFGASKAGAVVLEKLKAQYQVLGFIDNDQNKWQSTFQGLQVYPPEVLYEYDNQVTVVIASMYYREIIQQLRKMGWKNYRNYYHRFTYGFLPENWWGYIRLLLYPLILLITTPAQLCRTLWNARVLRAGNWGDYSQFVAHTGFTYLFYRSYAINFYRYGRRGTSKYTGMGDFQLARWVHLTLPSLYIYWIAGPVALLLGILGWWGTHFLWLHQASALWLAIVLGFALCSTTFYTNAFVLQNYNILGWLFFPAGLYAVINHHWLMAALVWVLISFSSVTVLCIGGLISIVFALQGGSFWPLIALIPATIKISTHFQPMMSASRGVKEVVGYFARALGFTDAGVKYRMVHGKTLWCERRLFYLILYLQFLMVFIFITHQLPWLILTGILIFLANSLLTRFADEQSIYMLMFSIATVSVIMAPNIFLLGSYWLVISPPPFIAKLPVKKITSIVPVLKPFYMKPFIDGMAHFFEPVPKGERVLMAFDNPGGEYERVFTPYQGLIELLTYVTTQREIHLFPNWHAVFETNYQGAPDFWGREPQTVKENLKQWRARYVIVYQTDQAKLNPVWQENGFQIRNVFRWNDYQDHLKDSPLSETENLSWWLLYY